MADWSKPTEQVTFWSGGIACAADLYLPDGPGPFPAVVMGHGHNCTKDALVPHASYLHRAGYAVMAIDFRTLGASEGTPRGQIFPREQSIDLRNAITFFAARPEVDAERIGLWGVSFSGGIVIHAAAFDIRVKACVAQSPIMNGRKWLQELRSTFDYNQFTMAVQDAFERSYGETPHWEVVPSAGPLTLPPPTVQGEVPPFDPENPNPVLHPMEAQKTYNFMISMESSFHMMDWNPSDVIDLIAPRPLLVIGNGGTGQLYDWAHTPEQINESFARAGHPKELRFLNRGMLDLYAEPGLGEGMAMAIEFYDRHLRGL